MRKYVIVAASALEHLRFATSKVRLRWAGVTRGLAGVCALSGDAVGADGVGPDGPQRGPVDAAGRRPTPGASGAPCCKPDRRLVVLRRSGGDPERSQLTRDGGALVHGDLYHGPYENQFAIRLDDLGCGGRLRPGESRGRSIPHQH